VWQVRNCLFKRLDGTGLFLHGYHRSAEIAHNEFVEIGDSCIVAWGDTSSALNANGSKALPGAWAVGPDARGGNQPWDTMIVGNIAHEIGLFQKQSSLCVLYLYLPVVFLPVALYEATATQVTWTYVHAGVAAAGGGPSASSKRSPLVLRSTETCFLMGHAPPSTQTMAPTVAMKSLPTSSSIRVSRLQYGVDVSDEEIIQALKDAKIWDFVDQEPDKLLSLIAEGGSNLSGMKERR